MIKYAYKLTLNKKVSKAVVKNCLPKYNKDVAWFDKQKARLHQKKSIRTSWHNWLHAEMMIMLDQKIRGIRHQRNNQTVKQSLAKTR